MPHRNERMNNAWSSMRVNSGSPLEQRTKRTGERITAKSDVSDTQMKVKYKKIGKHRGAVKKIKRTTMISDKGTTSSSNPTIGFAPVDIYSGKKEITIMKPKWKKPRVRERKVKSFGDRLKNIAIRGLSAFMVSKFAQKTGNNKPSNIPPNVTIGSQTHNVYRSDSTGYPQGGPYNK